MPKGVELSRDEIVFRRVPPCWIREDRKVDEAAFLPNQGDVDGLSLAHVATPEEAAATGRKGKKFYAVSLRVADLIDKNLRIVSDEPGHAIIEGWTAATRGDNRVRGLAAYMTTICGPAEGPFDGKGEAGFTPDKH